MQIGLYQKALALFIVVLFIEAGVAPATSSNNKTHSCVTDMDAEIVCDITCQTIKKQWSDSDNSMCIDQVDLKGFATYNDDFLDQYQILWNVGVSPFPPNLLAQSFKPSENILTRVKLLTTKTGTPSGDLVVSIRSSLNGTNLTSISVPAEEIPTDKDWVEFNFLEIVVNIGQTYYIIWSPSSTGTDYVWWGYDNSFFDSYPNGEAWFCQNGEWVTEGFITKDWCFKTYARHLDWPPNTPSTPLGPLSLKVGESGAYSTSATDPDGDQVQYRYDWDANGSHDYSSWTSLDTSGHIGLLPYTWSTAGTYVVKAQAKDEHGESSNWSDGLTVDVTENQKPTVQIIYPQEGKIYAGTISIQGAAEDTDGTVELVQVKIDSGSWQTATGTTSWMYEWDTTTLSDGNYTIKARSKDDNGEYSTVESVNVNVDNNDPPNKPDAPDGPSNLKVGESGTYSTSATESDGDQVQYRFDWDDGHTSDWTSLVDSGQPASKSHSWGSAGTYYVKAQAKDDQGAMSGWSNGLRITVTSPTNDPPYTPSTSNGPTTGYVTISYTYSTSTTDPNGDQVSYGWDWNGNDSVDEWTTMHASGVVVSVFHAWDSAGVYNVKVKAKDEHDAISDWSDPLVVTIYSNNPPETPSIDGPTSGRTGKMYEYTFLAADSNENDISYFIDWGDDTSTGWTEFIASETSVSAKHTWAEQNTFTIKAKAKDIHGAESDWATLSVSMPKSKPINPLFLRILEWLTERFPLFAKLLQPPMFDKLLNQ